jgi:digeranylgeranylglycerophospholipid reductase
MALPDQVDVLIVGAGPAGLAAAHRLADSRARVLLVDARARIGHPVRCAECSRAVTFDALGVPPLEKWVRWRLAGDALILNRPRLEEDLAAAVGARGAIVRAGASVSAIGEYDGLGRVVTVTTGDTHHRVRCGLIIAADGVASRVARLAGIETRLPLGAVGACLAFRLVDVSLRDPHAMFIDPRPALGPGYFWVFPTGPREANVGLGLAGARGFRARRLLQRTLRDTPALSGGRVAEEIVGLVPLTAPLEQPFTDGVLVAGTAARFVDAVMGEGIRQAAMSGRAAAQTWLDLGGREATSVRLASYRARLDDLYRELHGALERRREHDRQGTE